MKQEMESYELVQVSPLQQATVNIYMVMSADLVSWFHTINWNIYS